MAHVHSDKLPVRNAPAPAHDKLEGGRRLVMQSEFQPAGDQPTAIAELAQGMRDGERDQVLLGATGTGKTFTMANISAQLDRPTLVLAHNSTR